jgi:sugar lactone lactonase YvrE
MTTTPSELSALEETVRIPSPTPAPQSLAHDGNHLWVGSWETQRVYGLSPSQARVIEETTAPGRPVGATVVGDELRFVCSENGDADERFIRRFVPGHGFKSRDAVACPDDTGSFLAYDGEHLWLSQRYNKRVLELDPQHRVIRAVDVGEEILGMTWSGSGLYLSTWLGKERGGCRIAYLEPRSETSVPRFVAQAPFVAVSLAWDGDRLWTNDFKQNQIVAFQLPA